MQGPIDYDETIKHGLGAILKIIDNRMRYDAKNMSEEEYNNIITEREYIVKIAENPRKMLTGQGTLAGVVYRVMHMKICGYSGYSLKNHRGVRMLDSFLSYAHEYYNKTGIDQKLAQETILKLNKIVQLKSARGIVEKFKTHFLDFASPARFAVHKDIKNR